jgi:glutamate racemase
MNKCPIGIFDSGIGGFSILHAVHQLLPNENFIYVADKYYNPYGLLSEALIIQRSIHIVHFLIQKKVKIIIVACNTATAAAIVQLRVLYRIPIIGVEPALKPAIAMTFYKRIGILATHSTLKSKKYQDLKEKHLASIQITEVASSLFVELVEKMKMIDDSAIHKELMPFFDHNIDILILGCTHYPFLKKNIHSVMGKKVILVDSALSVAKELNRRLSTQFNLSQKTGIIEHYFSNASSHFIHLKSSEGQYFTSMNALAYYFYCSSEKVKK